MLVLDLQAFYYFSLLFINIKTRFLTSLKSSCTIRLLTNFQRLHLLYKGTNKLEIHMDKTKSFLLLRSLLLSKFTFYENCLIIRLSPKLT